VKPFIISGVIATCLCTIMSCVSCAVPAPPVRVVERAEATEIERFFQYFVYLRSLPPEVLGREYARQEAAFAQSHSAEDRLRLVLLLSLPDTDFGNRLYALELLQAYLNGPEPRPTDFMDIAVFLVTFMENKAPHNSYESRVYHLKKDLAEKEHQLAEQQKTIKKLQDELVVHRVLHNNINKKLQETISERERQLATSQHLNKKLQDEKRNVKRLQEKIEKIKDIEKSLHEREHTDNKGT
jgi:DNA repair exonuclease SbcCD ATPase subunit